MEDNSELSVNTKLFGFEGIQGRRDYFLNIVYISMISSIVTLPYIFWVVKSATTMEDVMFMQNLFASAPILLKIWTVITLLLIGLASASNAVRRLNDIAGKVINPLNLICGIIILISNLYFVIPFQVSVFAILINFILSIILLCKSGAITSKMPYDNTKIFNWGAFFGTWIWGLFNKSYKPLWYIILFFTPLSFLFQLVCGLKGNEWAYYNKKCDDVSEFNKSQETQATVFSILALVIFPVLYTVLITALVVVLAFVAADTDKHEDSAQTAKRIESVLTNLAESQFERYEIKQDVNNFYVNPSDWAASTFSDKKDLLEAAASMASIKRSSEDNSGKNHYSKTKELPRTKIYNSKNGELLGEFVLDEASFDSSKPFSSSFKAALKAYRFYKPTEK